MALSWQDYKSLRKALFRPYSGKEDLKELPNLPTKSQMLAAFEVIDTIWENNRATIKGQIDTAIGQIIQNTLAKEIGKCWLGWKFGKE